MGVGPDDSLDARDDSQTEDVGLPDHERDEGRRRAGGTGADDPAGVASLSDTGVADTDLPEHEDDRRRAADTGTAEQNP